MGWIIEFDGNYGRTGTIIAEVAVCCGCETSKPCIVIDQSQGEYNAGNICRDCALAMLDGLPAPANTPLTPHAQSVD